MGQDDWYRRQSWTTADSTEFHARLKRSRTAFHKAQYVRIQASYLADCGEFQAAMELLNFLYSEFPEESQLAQAHLQKARCLIALNRVIDALGEYRATLAAEKKSPNFRTYVWLEFPWFVVTHKMTNLYSEARTYLEWGERKAVFPVDEYRLAAIEAFMAADSGESKIASRHAKNALAAAAKDRSGFRYHAKLGLVTEQDPEVKRRLEELAEV